MCVTTEVTQMAKYRTLVSLPPDIVGQIDKAVGIRQRSAFLAELARRELKRREQQSALRAAAGAWKDRDHPELARGSAQHVAKLRAEDEKRMRNLKLRAR